MGRPRRRPVTVDTGVLVIAVLVMAFASTVQASVGFGANMMAAPVLAMLDPDLVPGPIFITSAALTLATALRERDGVDWAVVRDANIGRIPGSIVGGFVLAAVSDSALQLMVGLTILAAVALSTGFISIGDTRSTHLGAGVISGFGSTTAAIGGPPLALALQHRPGPTIRATMGAYFVVGTVITAPTIAWAGRLGVDELLVGSALVPGSLLGFVLSGPLRRHVDAGRARPLVLLLSALAAVILIGRTL